MGGYQHWKWALEHLIGQDVYIDTSSTLEFVDDATLKAIYRRHPRERILSAAIIRCSIPEPNASVCGSGLA
jgi:hypothetical protein